MDIASLLAPFIPEGTLSDGQLSQVSAYLDLLLKWNAKINLTAVRSPDEILTRHFGESFFLAHYLSRLRPAIVIPGAARANASAKPRDLGFQNQKMSNSANEQIAVDLGSGAGFPGLPLKIYAPSLAVTLIESNQKKATFLREVIRTLKLTDINVFSSRAEAYVQAVQKADFQNEQMSQSANEQILVSLRAVEHFDRILPLAAQIANYKLQTTSPQSPNHPITQSPNLLALLIGSSQLSTARRLLPHFSWDAPVPVPLSRSRILLFGHPLELSS